MSRLRVLVVDEQEIVHWGFRALLASQDWVERYLGAKSFDEALEYVRAYEPQVAVIDAIVDGEVGTTLSQEIRELCPRTRTLLMFNNGAVTADSARAAGASGSVPKAWSGHDLVSATRMVGLGMEVFAPQRERPAVLLSARERQVLEQIARGATNREIAARLLLSPHTVKDHTSTLYRKVNARNRADAIQRARRLGLLS